MTELLRGTPQRPADVFPKQFTSPANTCSNIINDILDFEGRGRQASRSKASTSTAPAGRGRRLHVRPRRTHEGARTGLRGPRTTRRWRCAATGAAAPDHDQPGQQRRQFTQGGEIVIRLLHEDALQARFRFGGRGHRDRHRRRCAAPHLHRLLARPTTARPPGATAAPASAGHRQTPRRADARADRPRQHPGRGSVFGSNCRSSRDADARHHRPRRLAGRICACWWSTTTPPTARSSPTSCTAGRCTIAAPPAPRGAADHHPRRRPRRTVRSGDPRPCMPGMDGFELSPMPSRPIRPSPGSC